MIRLIGLLLLLGAPAAGAQSLAFTFDDGPKIEDSVGMDVHGRNAALLGHIRRIGVRSILFVTSREAGEERMALGRQWGEQGQLIGNHTVTHRSLNSSRVSLADYEQELLDCDAAIAGLPGYVKWFRFPFLKEGNTVDKRDGFRAFLKSRGYRPAPVSIDTSDWYYDRRLRARLQQNPKADLAPYRDAYIAHLLDRASYYESLGQSLEGRSVAHVLLLHHNLINALFLESAAAALRQRGWKFLDAEVALADPLYRQAPDVLPAGDSILLQIARSRGVPDLRQPGEDEVYEKPVLDRLGL